MVEALKIKLERMVVEEVLRRKRIPYRIEEELRKAEDGMMRLRRDTLSKKNTGRYLHGTEGKGFMCCVLRMILDDIRAFPFQYQDSQLSGEGLKVGIGLILKVGKFSLRNKNLTGSSSGSSTIRTLVQSCSESSSVGK